MGFASIGIFSLGYILFVRSFAELHIQFSFLNFPIFIGEILLLLCIIFWGLKVGCPPKGFKKKHIVIVGYFMFVVFKALYGYHKWGPLALRDAALLYYPAFIILAYSFYQSEFFHPKKSILYLLIILSLLISREFGAYWTFTLFSLAFILICAQNNRKLKYLMFVILIMSAPYKDFFATSRMMMVSNAVVGVYLAVSFYFILKIKRTVKKTILIGSLILVAGGIIRFSDENALKSVVNVGKVVELFKVYDAQVSVCLNKWRMSDQDTLYFYGINLSSLIGPTVFQVKGRETLAHSSEVPLPSHIPQTITNEKERIIQAKEMRGYNLGKNDGSGGSEVPLPSHIPQMITNEKERIIQAKEMRGYNLGKNDGSGGMINIGRIKETRIYNPEGFGVLGGEPIPEITEPIDRLDEVPNSRNLSLAYMNTLFRLFLWRDMLVELVKEKPILGFDFGKPILPISFLALNWAVVEITRDGWVGAHNSYLHMIYRTGVIGAVFIITVLIFLFKMIGGFIQLRSVTGIVLCAIIIGWFVAANFLLIFELPYTAIPIWSLFGVTLAYYDNLIRRRDTRGF